MSSPLWMHREFLITAQLRYDAQFNLRVICRQQQIIFILWDRLCGFLFLFSTNRIFWRFGLSELKRPSYRDYLIVGSVNPACLRIYQIQAKHPRKYFSISQVPEIQNASNNRMLVFKFTQHILRGGILSRFCFGRLLHNFQYIKQNFPNLFWRRDKFSSDLLNFRILF